MVNCCVKIWLYNVVFKYHYFLISIQHWPGGGQPTSSCLENPMNRGAWPATIHGVTKSHTGLKWLSTHTRIQHCKLYRVLMLISIVFQTHPHIQIIDKMTMLMVHWGSFYIWIEWLVTVRLCPHTLTVSWQYPWIPCFLVSSRSIYKSSQFLPAVVCYLLVCFNHLYS